MSGRKRVFLVTTVAVILTTVSMVLLETSGGLGPGWRDRLTVLGLCVTFIGFGVAIIELRAVASAAESDRRAVRRVMSNELLFLGPQFGILAAHFDGAVQDNDHGSAQRLLALWSELASHVSGRLSVRKDVDEDLVATIRASTLLAEAARGRLDDVDVDVTESTRLVRDEIARVKSQVGELVGRILSEAGGA